MDRNNYKEIIKQVKNLIREGSYEDALDLLDDSNWRKIRNVNALIEVSKLYEQLDHIEDSKQLLLMAHERSPIGRMILYHLSLVCIKMGELEEATSYYEKFIEIAPHDSMKYILRYNLAKASDASPSDLVKILEEFKEADFREEWAFELAYLYHRTAQGDKCIALCNEIILWFGDGPYVEKALELKMLYSPLDKEQEEKYRTFQQNRKGYTHFYENEMLESGEIVRHDIAIPPVELEPEHFNTVNLQAQIKRNIEEIMEATEEKEVSENMENIKGLLEDIPYLQVQEDPESAAKKQEEEGKKIDDSLKSKFKELLAEERDGQISLLVPEDKEVEEQIEGQLSIQDVMDEWAKTQRAAEAALESAEEIKLQNAKDKALEEANQIMDKLSDVKPKLDAGVAPTELLKEEILSKPEEATLATASIAPSKVEELVSEVEAEEESVPESEEIVESILEPEETKVVEEAASDLEEPVEAEEVQEESVEMADSEVEADTQQENSEEENIEEKALDKEGTEFKEFTVPKVSTSGDDLTSGISIPVVDPSKVVAKAEEPFEVVREQAKNMSEWKPPVLSEEEIASSKVIKPDEKLEEAEQKKQANLEMASKLVEEINQSMQKQIDRLYEENESSVEDAKETEQAVDTIEDDTEDDLELSPVVEKPQVTRIKQGWEAAKTQVLPNISEKNLEEKLSKLEIQEDEEDDAAILANAQLKAETDSFEEDPFKPERDVELDEEPEEKMLREEVAKKSIENNTTKSEPPVEEYPQLTKEEREQFSYFMPINGMEDNIRRVLNSVRKHYEDDASTEGNIIIQGIPGSGKTMMATNIINVLQEQIGKPGGKVGKIDGDKLNGKDVQALFSKLKGGCLIIEKAGEINRETAVRLSITMDNDPTKVLVVLEDSKMGIERVSALSPELMKKFQEKVIIPPFTIDELVNFARTYASECECVIDELGILALYDRINIIQSLDHPTAIIEVKEIMDEAMEKADKAGGFKIPFFGLGEQKYDEDGFMILREKDFIIN